MLPLHMWRLLLIVNVITIVYSDDPIKSITGRLVIPNPSTARVHLNAGQWTAIPDRKGTFKFDGLRPGSYLLTFESIAFEFRPIRIDIAAKGRIRARYLTLGGNVVTYPLRITPERQVEYFESHVPFNPFSILKNPMMVMMLITVLMAFGLPRMLAAIDPEELQRAQQGTKPLTRQVQQ